MNVTLREGDEGDIGALMDVMENAFDPLFGEAWNAGQCLGILSLPDVWLTFAEAGDRTVGFALSRLLVDEAELLLLAVEPDVRCHGVGRALIERAVAIAVSKGAHRLLLEVRDGNQALDLYQGSGFSEIGRRRDYYRGSDGTTRDALTLARPIGDRFG
ncbi:MAG TPA: GNAT family N-acetyltransferase [Sphingomonas sp.]|uniref:GNAT family N-acetyltransferase n=1 Tax=Sphingomonas sp. TaxID=28214 RepID=UPI002C9D3816|nr:GNAT family N-acetyltransferase [Sphingomonas sp.]HMI21025.1 GNAT family N-acetyltransferase [Sphingomonas sp.]